VVVYFLHDFSNYQTKQSLVSDLEEPFRWLIDLTVVQAFEYGALDLHDFYFTGDDYRYRFEREAKQRFVDLIRTRFNAGAHYNRRNMKWDTIIEQKTIELSRFLILKSRIVDFAEPTPALRREDDRELRARILALTHEARELGIGKSTFYYMRKKAEGRHSFKLCKPIMAKISHRQMD